MIMIKICSLFNIKVDTGTVVVGICGLFCEFRLSFIHPGGTRLQSSTSKWSMQVGVHATHPTWCHLWHAFEPRCRSCYKNLVVGAVTKESIMVLLGSRILGQARQQRVNGWWSGYLILFMVRMTTRGVNEWWSEYLIGVGWYHLASWGCNVGMSQFFSRKLSARGLRFFVL
jgi:hypothetical protein